MFPNIPRLVCTSYPTKSILSFSGLYSNETTGHAGTYLSHVSLVSLNAILTEYTNNLDPDQPPSNSASGQDPRCLILRIYIFRKSGKSLTLEIEADKKYSR